MSYDPKTSVNDHILQMAREIYDDAEHVSCIAARVQEMKAMPTIFVPAVNKLIAKWHRIIIPSGDSGDVVRYIHDRYIEILERIAGMLA